MKKEQKKNPSIAGVIFSEDHKVLLIKRRDVPVWVLPGGGIENEETPEKAIIREIKEETGFEVIIDKKIGIYYPINRLSRLTFLYKCSIIKGKPTIGPETKDIAFFDLNHLPKYLPPPYKEWIEDGAKNSDTIIEKSLYCINYRSLLKNLILHPLLVIRFLLSRFGLQINS